jgi:uncharacterized protein involved in exopolysaccharide biosynthesis
MSGVEFSRRLADNFFRRWFWFVLPVVLIGGYGSISALDTESEYRTSGTLSASTNPLVEQPEIRGTEIGTYESAAQGAARLINEQLGTDAFVDEVAERSGLADAIDAGVVSRQQIRSSVWTTVVGQNFFRIWATWEDPTVALELVNGTIDSYLDELAEVAAADSLEAITFWERAEFEALNSVEAAEAELLEFLSASRPEGTEERSVDEELTVLRLNSAVEQNRQELNSAREQIERARLAVEQAESDAGRPLRVVDEPQVPQFPESTRRSQVVTVATFLILGVLVGGAALILSTALDRSIRSASQLGVVAGLEPVATAEYVKRLDDSRRRYRRKAA